MAEKVLITGGDGFTGSHLVDFFLDNEYKVRALVRRLPTVNIQKRPNLEIVLGDLTDYNSILKASKGVDYIIHAGAKVAIDETEIMKQSTLETNITGTLNLLTAAHFHDIKRVLYISTCHIYGNQSNLPLTEDTNPNPTSLYAISKYTAEKICRLFMDQLEIVITRCFNKFGERQKPTYLVPKVIIHTLQKMPLELGNPEPTRDYVYIKDAVRGYFLALLSGRPGHVYNLATGIERSVQEVVTSIFNICGYSVPVKWNPEMRSGVDILRSRGDYTKARMELGWKPEYDYREALIRTIDWYKASMGRFV